MQHSDQTNAFFESHTHFREARLTHRRFKHADLQPLLTELKEKNHFRVSTIGASFEGRSIQMVEIGNGPIPVLLWSQMHGDEPTATMAMFDLFHFFDEANDEWVEFRKALLSSLTLYFVPMLNPDGAERYIRRTAQGIDMNRDALALQTPEARLLKHLVDTISPQYAFNLHDQNPRYTAGISNQLATISFLATSYDYALSVNEVRLRSMQLISVMNKALQQLIPGQIGRFNDDHEPRAFGDNIQKWGTTLILIESGGYAQDIEKQEIRRLNYVALLTAFQSLVSSSWQHYSQADYQTIPINERARYDLLLRNISIGSGNNSYKVDFGINRYEINNHDATQFYYKSIVDEVGDLQVAFGTEEEDVSGFEYGIGKIYGQTINSIAEIIALDAAELLATGIIYLRVIPEVLNCLSIEDLQRIPFHLITDDSQVVGFSPLEEKASFVLKNIDGKTISVVNGFILYPEKLSLQQTNGIFG